ncbi:unnamed protein product [Diatraea saccharalis]|uniref:DHHA2 domain-containing protein n=1 Tax=Diatraea saccharalis TaxID=40085 RepID=A0A9N9R5C0_9NEOP|nr:unnamed protein product [Diatraea saccharalis]
MEDYFNTLNKLKSMDYNELTIVLGNESCDLDSAVSSFVYALFLHWQYHQIKCKVCTRNKRDETVYKDNIFVFVLNVDRQDYDLKTEVAYLFRQHSINDSQIVFKNDIDLKQLIMKKPTKIILVDHHTLALQDQFLAPYVTEVIDHRPRDESGWNYKEDTRSTIELVGSCTTLVTQRIKDLSALMSKELEFFNAYPITSDMLHCTIILDTVNFSKEFNKATSHDEEIIRFLETLLKPDDRESYRKTKLELLMNAKADVSSLTPAQLLRKDTKIFGDILVPSFPLLVREFLEKPNVEEALKEALITRNCSIAVLLGMDLKAGIKRDAAICANETDRADQLATFLENWDNPPLQLTPQISRPPAHRYYEQLNLSATRKQYVPALKQFLNNKSLIV